MSIESSYAKVNSGFAGDDGGARSAIFLRSSLRVQPLHGFFRCSSSEHRNENRACRRSDETFTAVTVARPTRISDLTLNNLTEFLFAAALRFGRLSVLPFVSTQFRCCSESCTGATTRSAKRRFLQDLFEKTLIRTNCDSANLRPLPQVLVISFRSDIELRLKAILYPTDHHTLVFERLCVRNVNVESQ